MTGWDKLINKQTPLTIIVGMFFLCNYEKGLSDYSQFFKTNYHCSINLNVSPRIFVFSLRITKNCVFIWHKLLQYVEKIDLLHFHLLSSIGESGAREHNKVF